MSSGAFSNRALRIGAKCRREAIIALKPSKKSPSKSSGRRKIAMLPTCIGISGVSRYKKDASNEDSFLPSPMCFPPADFSHGALAALLALRLIVHVLPPHMQWQTARIGQIAGSGPLPE